MPLALSMRCSLLGLLLFAAIAFSNLIDPARLVWALPLVNAQPGDNWTDRRLATQR